MKCPYWTSSGWSRPNCLRMASRSALLAPGSTRSTAGSPVTRTKKKMVTESRNSEISEYPIRRSTKRFISLLL